jgi:hypothetical protein
MRCEIEGIMRKGWEKRGGNGGARYWVLTFVGEGVVGGRGVILYSNIYNTEVNISTTM